MLEAVIRVFRRLSMRNALRVVTLLLASQAECFGLPIEPSSYESLLSNADLVIICNVVSSVDVIDMQKEFVGTLVQQSTLCTVEAVLKGDVEGRSIQLVHLRRFSHEEQVGRRASNSESFSDAHLIVFADKESDVEVLDEEAADALFHPNRYLLFLESRGDGTYQPVTGLLQAAFSVYRLDMATPMAP